MVIDIDTKEGTRVVVTDPGSYSIEEHDKIVHADIILITHEHQDHFHIESVKSMAKRMPDAAIIANDAVGEILAKEGIKHRIMKHGDEVVEKGVKIQAYGKKHAVIHKSIPTVSNVGYLLEDKLFFPGDAFSDPKRPFDVLALPTTGPWLKVSEPIDYALQLKPKKAFPVHDAFGTAFTNTLIGKVLGENGIDFIALENGGELDV